MTMERDDDVIDRRADRDRRGRVRRYVGVAAGAAALLIVGAREASSGASDTAGWARE